MPVLEKERRDAPQDTSRLSPSLSLSPTLALCWREIIKFVRDRSRLVGALVQPLGFWLLLGLGFQGTFALPGAAAAGLGYMEFLFPGIIAMVLLFTAIFSTMPIVEERTSGFLQAALVAPLPRITLVLGTTLGGTLLATAEALLFLLLAPIVGLSYTASGLLFALLICFLTGLAFTALGFLIAWRMESTRGFHTVMNLFLLPLWLLSGAFFPLEGAAPLLRWIMWLNPVTYAVSGIRQGLYWPEAAPVGFAAPGLCLLVTAAFAFAILFLSARAVRRPLYA